MGWFLLESFLDMLKHCDFVGSNFVGVTSATFFRFSHPDSWLHQIPRQNCTVSWSVQDARNAYGNYIIRSDITQIGSIHSRKSVSQFSFPWCSSEKSSSKSARTMVQKSPEFCALQPLGTDRKLKGSQWTWCFLRGEEEVSETEKIWEVQLVQGTK